VSEQTMPVSEVLAVLDDAIEFFEEGIYPCPAHAEQTKQARAVVAELAQEVERLNDAIAYSERAFNAMRDERDALRRRVEELERDISFRNLRR